MQNFFDQFDEQPRRIQVRPADPSIGDQQRITRNRAQASEYDDEQAASDLRARNLANQLAEMKLAEEKRKADEEAAAKIEEVNARTSAINELVSTIEAARDARRLSKEGWFATGFGSGTARDWGGSSAADVKGRLDTIGGNVAFDRLQRMRDASKTGGALGSVSEKELDLLRGTIASLDQTQSDEQFQKQMDRIIEVYSETLGKVAPDALARLNGEDDQGIAPMASDRPLPRASGVRPSNSAPSDGVTASHRGGFRQVPSLAGIEQDVINMVGQGASATEIMGALNKAYEDTTLEHGGRVRASPELGVFIGDLVDRHRANPAAPVRSLASGWEMLSGYEAPEQETSLLNPSHWLGAAADTNIGNFAMNAANAATAGLPAYLAGGPGEGVIAAARNERPLTSLTGDVTGTIGGMVGTSGLLSSAGKVGAKAATMGGGIIPDVAFNATRGSLEGGAEGGLLMGALAGAGNVAGRYAIAPAAVAAASTRPGQAAINLTRQGANAIGNARRGLFGQAPRPFQPTTIPQAVPRGQQAIVNRLPGDAAGQLKEAVDMGMPLTVADLSPELQALAGSAVRKSPDARMMAEAALRPRSAGQAERALEQIGRNFGTVDNPVEVSEGLLQAARARSTPLYDAFRAEPARTSPALDEMLSTPAGRRALQNARTIAANEGRNPEALGFGLNDLGEVSLNRSPSPETLDLVKRGLDDVVSNASNPITRRVETDAGRAVEGLRKRFVAEVDQLYPNTYAQARAAYAGPASQREALQAGRDAIRSQPRDIEPRLQKYSDAERGQFQLGLRSAMADAVDGTRLSSNPYQRIYGSQTSRDRAATVFGEGPANQFQRAFDIEDNMGRTYTEALGGSQTQPRASADEAFDVLAGNVADAGGALMFGGGGLQEIGRGLMRRARDNWRVGASKKVADDMAPLLFSPQPAQMAQAIEELAAQSAARNVYVQGARKRLGIFGSSLGASSLPAISQ